MAIRRVVITADTSDASRKVDALDKQLTRIEKPKKVGFEIPSFSDVGRTFDNLSKEVESAANGIRQLYKVAKMLPGDMGEGLTRLEATAKKTAEVAMKAPAAIRTTTSATKLLETTVTTAGGGVNKLIENFAKLGFAIFGITQGLNIVKAAFGGFFKETVGRQIQLEETILKTQTTLASTNRIFSNGAEITKPYEKIVALTGEIGKRIDSIRERSLELAGVTSNEVIEIFGLISSQIGQVGGDLKDAEDLAINFSAALGTFGIPLYQARQEIGSILRGDITVDSYLAKALGITNKDIADAKSKAGGVVAFINEKLATAAAGQKIAAQGFAGVYSNIQDIQELIAQKFGAGLLAPMLQGLTAVFNSLNKIRDEIFAIAEGAGRMVGRIATGVVGQVRGRVAGGTPESGDAALKENAEKARNAAEKVFAFVEQAATRSIGAISNIIASLAPTIQNLAAGFALIAKAVIEIKVGNFEALLTIISNLVSVFANLATAASGFLKVYAGFLDSDLVQYFSQVTMTLGFLKKAFLDTATNAFLLVTFITKTLGPLGATIAGVAVAVVASVAAIIAAIGALILVVTKLVTAIAAPMTLLPAVKVAVNELIVSLTALGNSALSTSAKLEIVKGGLAKTAAGIGALGKSILATTVIIGAIQFALAALVDGFGRWQRAQEEVAGDRRAEVAITRLSTTYANLTSSTDAATKAQADFEKSIVQTRFNKYIQELNELRDKMVELRAIAAKGNSFDSFFQSLNPENIKAGLQYIASDKYAAGKTKAQRDAAPTYSQIILQNAEAREKDIVAKVAQFARQLDKERAVENLKLLSDNLKNLQKEQKALDKVRQDLERAHNDRMFQQRQQIIQLENQNFQTIEQFRIRIADTYNQKLIEGEKNGAAAALAAVANYLSVKKKGELDIEMNKRDMQLQAAELDKSIADYRIQTEERIFALRERITKFEMEAADYIRQQKEAEATIAAGSFNSGDGSMGNVLPKGSPVFNMTSGVIGADRGGRKHQGQDIGVDGNSPVMSRLAGVITEVIGKFGTAGGAVRVKYDNGEEGTYGHINRGSNIRVGTRVQAGEQIGTVTKEMRGGKENSHLHYELRSAVGGLINPLNALRASLERPKTGSAGAAASGGSVPSNMWRMLEWISSMESGDSNKAYNRKSGATGRLQYLDSTRTDLARRYGISAADLISNDKNKQYAAASEHIRRMFPTAYAQIGAGNFDRAAGILNGTWTSLPGGAEAATGDRAKRGIAARDRGTSAGSGATGGLPAVGTPIKPTLGLDNLPEIQTAQFAKNIERIKQLKQQYADLQKQILATDAKDAYDKIIPALFPKRDFKEAENQFKFLEAQLRALGETSADTFNPELLRVQVQQTEELRLVEEKYNSFLKDAPKLKGYTAELGKKIAADAKKAYEEEQKAIRTNYDWQVKLLKLKEQEAYITGLIAERKQIAVDTELETLKINNEISKMFADPKDIAGNRRRDTEFKIESRRITDADKLKDPASIAEFERWADALRKSSAALGVLETKAAKLGEKLALARDFAGTFTSGFKGIASALLKGGDIGEAMNSAVTAMADKFIEKGLEYAFKPIEESVNKLFQDFLGVKDPTLLSTDKNTSATDQNTQAITALTSAVSAKGAGVTDALGGTSALSPENGKYAGAFDAKNNIVPFSKGFDKDFGAGLDFKAFNFSKYNFEGNFTQLSTDLTAWNTEMPQLSKTINDITAAAQDVPASFSGLQSGVGKAVGALSSIAMGVAGFQQIGKGGTYNTLMGLSGIFGSIGGLTGMFRAGGGPVVKGQSYVVGEKEAEIFVPTENGQIYNSSQYKKSFANTEQMVEDAQFQSILTEATNMSALTLQYESIKVNEMTFVTPEQLRATNQATLQEATKRGAALGKAQNIKDLRNSVRYRRLLK
jgi:murein DD-endopeptidase MepM/ murein hydrolase activator NlpD